MSALLRTPLLPTATVATVVALAGMAGGSLAIAAGAVLGLACAALAVASGDRTRRLLWWSAAAVAVACALRTLSGPLPLFDLRHAGPLDAVREALASPLRRLVPEPESGILLGIVLGERASVAPDLAYAFSRTGTTHLLAIDGFKLALVASAVVALLRGRARPSVAALGGATAAVAYGVLVGLGPAPARASIMAVIAAFAVARGRRGAGANGLCAAVAAMLLIDPSTVANAGFLLSAAGTGGIVAFHAPIAARLRFLPAIGRHALAATLAVTVPTLPITAAAFGQVSLVSPLANVLAVPLLLPIMAASAAAMLVGTVSPILATPLALAAYVLTVVLRVIVEVTNGLPLAALQVPAAPLSGAVVALLTVAIVVAGARLSPRLGRALRPRVGLVDLGRRLAGQLSRSATPWAAPAIALVAALVVAASLASGVSLGGPPLRIRALDVGQGDAFLIEVAGHVALVDGGPDPSRLLAELGASLPPWTRRIDLIALTHAHTDHGAGLLAVLDRYEIGLAIEPVGLNEGPLATAWSERIARNGCARRAVAAGARIKLGDATIAVLAPGDDPKVDVPSLVLRLERGSFSMLFMGDATEQAQADLLLGAQRLGSRVYVPPHHGAATSHASELVTAIHPEAAVLSVGAGNRYGHPTSETLTALGAIATYRTDRDGTVEIALDGPRLVVHAHANGLPPPRGGSVPYAPAAR